MARSSLSTITSQASYISQLRLTQETLSFHSLLKVTSDRALCLNTQSVFEDYMRLIRQGQCVKVSFSEEQAKTYAYKPKMLADLIYKNTELYYIILKANYMKSVSDFSQEALERGIIVPTSGIMNYLDEVLIKEEMRVNDNRQRVLNDVNSL